jgi:hypothetical protein
MAFLWNPQPTSTFTPSGGFASGAAAYFYVGGSTTPLTVYLNSALTNPAPWPVVANLVGVFPPIYIPYGNYGVRVITATGALIFYAGDIDNPAPPSSGGGIVVTQSQIWNTGFAMWTPMQVGQISGFVRMNGNTLGNTGSAATEYAAADASALFSMMWSNLPDSIATVSGGRGASAAADFSANKTIVIPTMQGLVGAGLDDMGANAAGNIQAVTTCSPSGASPTVVVASAAAIVVGHTAIINGVPIGTVTAISGTSITLSAIPAAGVGVVFRSSFFTDAQQLAAAAGIAYARPSSDQIPAHSHSVTDPGHTHNYRTTGAGIVELAGGITTSASNVIATTSALTGISINNAGGGNPFNILQPTRLGTWYCKL